MLQSILFSKTKKTIPKEAETISYKLLLKADFIDKLASGIYNFLPLGWRVHRKIESIIRREMENIGAQEVFLPALQPKNIWEESGRWDAMDPPLFKLEDRHKKEFALGSTHEEVITLLAKERIQSYKDLPKALFQIQSKFRNEMRFQGGILRSREFIMKDLYSFHADEKDLAIFYEKVKQAYFNIFNRCKLEVVSIPAKGGSIGGSETHEFLVFASAGEDKVVWCKNCKNGFKVESLTAFQCKSCQKEILARACIETGHIFKLGSKYADAFSLKYLDKSGISKQVSMGCYGIGLGRLIASIVEVNNDKDGIVWPMEVAPFLIHIIALGDSQEINTKSKALYDYLLKNHLEVLLDDRDVSAGVKFVDADLIGIPIQIVISEKTKERNFEVCARKDKKSQALSREAILDYAKQYI